MSQKYVSSGLGSVHWCPILFCVTFSEKCSCQICKCFEHSIHSSIVPALHTLTWQEPFQNVHELCTGAIWRTVNVVGRILRQENHTDMHMACTAFGVAGKNWFPYPPSLLREIVEYFSINFIIGIWGGGGGLRDGNFGKVSKINPTQAKFCPLSGKNI